MAEPSRSAVLLSPVEEEMRVVLRRLFVRLLEMDPERYNPLYVGPVRRGEPVRRALQEAADAAGIAMLEPEQVFDPGVQGGVAIVPLTAAGQIVGPEVAGRRWVIVGGTDPDQVPVALLERLREDGLIYDTRQVPAPTARPGGLAAELERRVATGGHWVLAVVTDADEADAVAGEAALRLRRAGCRDARVVATGTGTDAARVPMPGAAGALVVCVDAVPPRPAITALIESAREHAVAVVLVAPAAVIRVLEKTLALPAADVVRASRLPVPEAVRQAPWPPVSEVLTGGPAKGAFRELIFPLEPGTRHLWQVIRSAAAYGRLGYVLVYSPKRFGWILVDGDEGEVGGAWIAGDATDRPLALADAMARARAMALWEDIRILFVAASDPHPVPLGSPRVVIDTVVVDIMRTIDEVRAGSAPAGTVAAPHAPLKPSRVAEHLLWWGQARYAYEVLEVAERASSWGVDEDLMLGYLSAERDPHEAAARLQHAALRLSTGAGADVGHVQQMDATLSALLLEVRARPSYAFSAWAVVERWLESQGDGFVHTSRHAALLYELAARAGQIVFAIRFRDRLRALAGPGDPLPEWLESSDPLPALEAVP